jgi:uncharacterized membrane protein
VALQTQRSIDVQEAAVLIWEPGAKCPEIHQLHGLVEQSELSSKFWAGLFGQIFPAASYGWAGGGSGCENRIELAEFSIGNEFIKQVHEKVTEGTSAFFLLTSNSLMEKVVQELQGLTFEIVFINLPKAQEDELRGIVGKGFD